MTAKDDGQLTDGVSPPNARGEEQPKVFGRTFPVHGPLLALFFPLSPHQAVSLLTFRVDLAAEHLTFHLLQLLFERQCTSILAQCSYSLHILQRAHHPIKRSCHQNTQRRKDPVPVRPIRWMGCHFTQLRSRHCGRLPLPVPKRKRLHQISTGGELLQI